MLEKSAGAVVFRKKKGVILYLLLHYPGLRGKGHWDFPKGKIEKGETLEETVKREMKEETNIERLAFVKGFKEAIKYFFKFEGKSIFKIATFFLAETDQEEVKISREHKGFKWLPYREALEQVTFKKAKDILKKANDFLQRKSV